MTVRFEWDAGKERTNVAKHGVGFDEAARVFSDPYVIIREDRVVEGEERLHAIGYVDRVLLVVHTLREEGTDAVIASFQRVRRRRRKRGYMKKPSEKSTRMVRKTIEQIENRRMTKVERERLKRIAALPGDRIDTTDIPEVKDRKGWVRIHQHPEHRLHRVLSRLLSIRLPEPDIDLAQKLARSKGLPYQTYIKSLLHEALERDRALAERK
jgi:uncharacterized DUF497 family protein